MNKRVIVAYALLLFILGCSVGALIPSFPVLLKMFHVSFSHITLLIAIMGFASILFSYPAAWLTARHGGTATLRLAAVVLVVGLFIRAVSHSYTPFFLGQVLVVLTMPLCYGPIGAILRNAGVVKLRSITSVIIGSMPLGLGLFSLIGHDLSNAFGLFPSFFILAFAGLIVGIFLFVVSNELPRPVHKPGEALPRLTLKYSPWWIVAFCVFGIPNTINAISAPAMLHLHVPDALAVGGLLGGLVGFGGSLVTMGLGILGEVVAKPRVYIRFLTIVNVVVVAVAASIWSGAIPFSRGLAEVFAVLVGGFGFAIFSLLNAEGAREAELSGQAGVNTSIISMGGNLGGSLLQSFVAPFVVSQAGEWIAILTGLSLFGVVFAFLTGRARALPMPSEQVG